MYVTGNLGLVDAAFSRENHKKQLRNLSIEDGKKLVAKAIRAAWSLAPHVERHVDSSEATSPR